MTCSSVSGSIFLYIIWGEVKDDAREAPVYFVDRIIKRWDAGEFGSGPFWFDDPWNELIRDERAQYVDTRINTILGTVLRVMRENFVLIAILVVLILLVAFLKFHRDLLEVCILSAGTVGFFALMVFIIPVYLPMLYNFLVDKTSSTTAYKVLALQAEENTVDDKSIIEIDSDGNYVYNTSSLTLFKVDIKDLNRFYDNMSVSAEDVTAGKTVILNQEAGIFMEGDSIKINTDILFDTLPITGSYKPSLICDYLKNGYKIYLLEETYAQLHKKASCVLIDYVD